MSAVSVRPSRSGRYIDDGEIVLTTGRAILLSEISGKIGTRSHLRRLAAAVQRQMDHWRLIADLEDIDPDKTHALAGDDAWFTGRYGGRMFIDGASLVSRSGEISFTMVDGDLVPRVSVVR